MIGRRVLLALVVLLICRALPADAQAQRKGWLVYNRLEDKRVGIGLVRVDGTDRKVLATDDALDPSFTPDGRRLIFSRIAGRQATSEIVEYALDKGEPRVLATLPFYVFSPSLSPDGRWMTFCGMGDKMRAAVYVMETRLGTPRAVGPQGALAPRWSPDGRRLAFCWYDEEKRKVGVGVIDPFTEGAAVRNVYEHSHAILSLAWSPDGRRIAFVQTDGTDSGRSFVHVIDADGRNEKTVTPAPGTRIGVEWSDDGKTLFTSLLDIPNRQSGLAAIRGEETTPLFQEKGPLCLMSGGFAMLWLSERAAARPAVQPASETPKTVNPKTVEPKTEEPKP